MKKTIRDLADKDQHNLKLQFQVGLGIILFCFCLFTATIIYHFQKNLLEEETLRQAELVMTSLESTRSYIREVLRPRMYEEIGEDRFIIEAMSTSYITRVIMDLFKQELPDFKYRRVAIDARNPAFEANRQEHDMIQFFREHPDSLEWHGLTHLESERFYTLSLPVTFTDSCLHCHGDPADAPPAIKTSYGPSRGFHRPPDEISGIQSISIPVEVGLAQIRQTSFRMFGTVLILALLLYATIWLLFHQLIISNLRELLTLFRTTLDESVPLSAPLHKKGHKEEMEELYGNARTLVSHLHDSRTQLLQYTDNLEVMVAERTEALECSEKRLRDQVKKRNRELMLHNTLSGLVTRTETLQTILHQVLYEVLQVIPAQGAGIYLYDDRDEIFSLQCANQAEMLPEYIDLKKAQGGRDTGCGQQYATNCDQIRISSSQKSDTLNISTPLCCRNQLRGIMVITELSVAIANDALHELLLSIGQQIGQTIESLQNIQDLRRSSELLQSVFNGISDPLMLLDPKGTFKMVNQAFLKMYDLAMDQVLGMKAGSISSKQQCFLGGRLQELDLERKKPHTEEIRLHDGSIFDLSLYPILEENQSVHAIVCLAQDVTSLKETERRIQQAEKLVAIGQLAAGVAHEINNPLGVILCYSDIIKDGDTENKKLVEDINIIERQAENCRRIVADLLDFSRSRGLTLTKQVESVNESVEEVITMVLRQFQKKQIQLKSNLDKDLPPCLIDSQRIKQVLLNLIMNSSQAIEGKGNITLSTRSKDGNIEIEVEDDGPGIAKDNIDKVFDPFFSTKEPGQGTGLGLSISYGIMQEHDGKIRVQSTPGRGTRFTLLIPATKEQESND